jgi:hypothetical protein
MTAEEIIQGYGMAAILALIVSAIIIDYFNQPE